MGVRGAEGCWREVSDFWVGSGLRCLNEGVWFEAVLGKPVLSVPSEVTQGVTNTT